MAPVATAQAFIMKFNKKATLFAIATPSIDQHRLMIWDTQTGKQVNKFSDSKIPSFSCITWGAQKADMLNDNADGKKTKKRKAENVFRDLIAIGTPVGDIHIYSLSHGNITQALTGSHLKSVSDLCFSEDGTELFSASVDGMVVRWDVATGKQLCSWRAENGRIDKICVLTSGLVATAGESVKFWDVKSMQQTRAFIGFSTAVSEMEFNSADGQLLSASKEDRFINVSSVDNTRNFVLACPANVVQVLDSKKYAACVGADGIVYFWKKPLIPGSSQKRKIKSRVADGVVSIKDMDSEDRLPILAAVMTGKNQICIVRGSSVVPVFETIEFISESGELGVSLERQKNDSSLMQVEVENTFENTIQQKFDDSEAMVIGPLDVPIRSSTHVETLMSDTVSLGDKLKALKILEAEPEQEKKIEIPKPDSLLQILTQALHSNDNQLLEECLHVSQLQVIQKTVSKLPTEYVLKFLEQVVDRFQMNANRGPVLAKWLKAILMSHMAYLVSLPDIAQRLAPLYQSIDSRVSNFSDLLRLNGRLQVLAEQINSRKELARNMQEMYENLKEPMILFEENEEE